MVSATFRHWAIIPAAGAGSRVGSATPKQYLPINDTTVIEASLDCFLKHPEIAGVVVALHEGDQHWATLSVASNEKIHTVVGGESRADSVNNAVEYLINTPADDKDFVLVHDAARPCLRYSDLELLISTLETDEVGGVLASPVSDTLKLVKSKEQTVNTVSETLDRDKIWRAFTPQMFRLKLLKQALTHSKDKSIVITDEASAIEAINQQVKLLKGHSDNIKITHQEDLELAEVILKKQGR